MMMQTVFVWFRHVLCKQKGKDDRRTNITWVLTGLLIFLSLFIWSGSHARHKVEWWNKRQIGSTGRKKVAHIIINKTVEGRLIGLDGWRRVMHPHLFFFHCCLFAGTCLLCNNKGADGDDDNSSGDAPLCTIRMTYYSWTSEKIKDVKTFFLSCLLHFVLLANFCKLTCALLCWWRSKQSDWRIRLKHIWKM